MAVGCSDGESPRPKTLNGFIGEVAEAGEGGSFARPRDVAVYRGRLDDPKDDKIFVVEAGDGDNRVQRLDGSGNFERAWGKDVVRRGGTSDIGVLSELCDVDTDGAQGCKSGVAGSREGEFDDPAGVAVSEAGNVYVLDRGNRRVQEFDLDGGFVRAWGWGVRTGAAEFEICTDGCRAGRAGRSEGDGNPGQFADAPGGGIAVTPGEDGSVLATDGGNRRVMRFSADGQFAEATDLDTGAGWPRHVAVDSSGIAYASDSSHGQRIVRFDSAGSRGTTLGALPARLLGGTETLGLEADPDSGRLLVARAGGGTLTVAEIAGPGAGLDAEAPPEREVVHRYPLGEADGIGVDPGRGNVYVATSAPTEGIAVLASGAGPVSAAIDKPVQSAEGSTVDLEGTVGGGAGVAGYRFQVAAGNGRWEDVGPERYTSGADEVPVSTEVGELVERGLPERARLVVVKRTGADRTATASASSRRAAPEVVSGFIGGAAGVDTGGRFTEPSDVAVYAGEDDGAGDDKIFVVEADGARNGRVQRLDRDGNFELMWGRDVVRAGAPGDTGSGYEVCRDAPSCKAAPAGTAEGEFASPTGIAVSQETGHVYVMDLRNGRVQEFEGDGRFVRAWGWGVASGAAKFEVCTADCQAGRIDGAEGNANAGQFSYAVNGGIAVRPDASSDVYVTDGLNHRVMQFEPDGGFVRAWGLGVDTGGEGFEVCTADSGCQAGTTRDGRGFARGSWPRHVAVDSAGVVYGSDDTGRSQVVRFESDPAPDPSDAGEALLDPLPSGHRDSGDTNMGLEIDPVSGNLIVVWDRYGPAVVDDVSDPGADLDGSPRPERHAISMGSYIESANGVSVSRPSGAIYIAKSNELNSIDPGLMFSSCSDGDVRGDCHGLIVIATGHPPTASVGAPRALDGSTVLLDGSVTPHGAVTYRFQISRDGKAWRDVGRPRYVTGATGRAVGGRVSGLKPDTLYRTRLVVVKLVADTSEEERVVSSEAFVLTGDNR